MPIPTDRRDDGMNGSRRSRFPLVVGLVAALSLSVLGCGDSKGAEEPRASREEVHPFQFDSLDERPVSRDAFVGKPAVIVFLTTWDLASQAQVTILVKMAEHDGPAVRYAMVALHERHERELVETYARSLKVPFPVALSDAETRIGRGPLGDVHMIPTTLVIDAEGRLVKKHVGVTRPDVLRPSVEAAKATVVGGGR